MAMKNILKVLRWEWIVIARVIAAALENKNELTYNGITNL